MNFAREAFVVRKACSWRAAHGIAVLISMGVLSSAVQAQQFVYWSTNTSPLWKSDPSDVQGTKQQVFPVNYSIGYLTVLSTGGKFYWTVDQDQNFTTGPHIERSDFDGLHHEIIYSLPVSSVYTELFGLAVDETAQRLYFSIPPNDPEESESPPVLMARMDLDGNNVQTVGETGVRLLAVAVDHEAGKVCWLGGSSIRCTDLYLNNLQTIKSGINEPHSIAIDLVDHKVYWSDFNHIGRANLDGSNEETVRLWGFERSIAIDRAARLLYWIELPNKMYRSNLDGSGLQTILTTNSQADYLSGFLTLGPDTVTALPGVPAVSTWSLEGFALSILCLGTLVIRFKLLSPGVARQAA